MLDLEEVAVGLAEEMEEVLEVGLELLEEEVVEVVVVVELEELDHKY